MQMVDVLLVHQYLSIQGYVKYFLGTAFPFACDAIKISKKSFACDAIKISNNCYLTTYVYKVTRQKKSKLMTG